MVCFYPCLEQLGKIRCGNVGHKPDKHCEYTPSGESWYVRYVLHHSIFTQYTLVSGSIWCVTLYNWIPCSWWHMMATNVVLWQKMYRNKDWFIHLLILNTCDICQRWQDTGALHTTKQTHKTKRYLPVMTDICIQHTKKIGSQEVQRSRRPKLRAAKGSEDLTKNNSR